MSGVSVACRQNRHAHQTKLCKCNNLPLAKLLVCIIFLDEPIDERVVTTRILVGLIALPLIVALLWLGGIWSLLLILAVALAGGFEFFTLLAQGGHPSALMVGMVWIAALVSAGWRSAMPELGMVITAGLVISLTYVLFVPNKPLQVWLATCGGAIYLGVMMAQAMALRQLPHGLWWILFALFITFTNDTGAYFVGVTMGRHRLWPRLSPKKTWEGTITGWIAAALGGALFVALSPLQMPFLYGALLRRGRGCFRSLRRSGH